MVLSAWLVLIVVLVVILCVVALAARALHKRRVTEPSCGRCGYAVRGLTSFECPECGSDLREAGILAPNMRGGLPVFPALALAWTIALITASAIIIPMLGTVTPYATQLHQRRVIFMQGQYPQSMTLDVEGWALTTGLHRNQPAPMDRYTVRLSNGMPGPELRIDGRAGAWELEHNGLVRRGSTLDAAALHAFMVEAGADPMNTEARADAAHAVRAIDEMKTTAGGGFTRLPSNPPPGTLASVTAHPTHTYGFPGSAPWYRITAAVIAMIVWVAGLVWLGRRAGARLRSVAVAVVAIFGLMVIFVLFLGVRV